MGTFFWNFFVVKSDWIDITTICRNDFWKVQFYSVITIFEIFLFQKIESKMPAAADPLHIEGGEGGVGTGQLVSKNVIYVGTNLILISI